MPLSMHSSAMVRPQILQYISIATWNKNQCGKFPPDQITENMLCAGKSCSFVRVPIICQTVCSNMSEKNGVLLCQTGLKSLL